MLRGGMKKCYLIRLIEFISYNLVDVTTASTFKDCAHVKDSWIDKD